MGGSLKKEKLENVSDSMGNACYVMLRVRPFVSVYAHVPTAPGPIHCTEILRNKISC